MDENGLSNSVIGAAIEVHKQLGPGLLESCYQAAMEYEFKLRGIPFERQKPVPIFYKGRNLFVDFRLDLVVSGLVIVELKSVEAINPIHEAQLKTYMKLTGCKPGLLLNFNVVKMKEGIHRIAMGLPSTTTFPGQRKI